MPRQSQQPVRAGWARASRAVANADDDKLVWPEFANEAHLSVYRLKITLADVRPPVWRRVDVLGRTTLPRLHQIIQAAMGWNDAHLHVFRAGQLQYGVPDPELPFVNERRVRLDDVVSTAKESFSYVYDFGDHWLHTVLVESISPAEAGTQYPRFIGGRGACPPEDVGGPPGFESFVNIISDPSHPQHAAMSRWVGGRFDPAALDVGEIRLALRRIARR